MIVSKNLKSHTLSQCEHLITVTNRYTGQTVRVPCGECKTCILNNTSKYSRLCSIEESQYKYCLFVTLTYAPEWLPTMQVVPVTVERYKSLHYVGNYTEKYSKELYLLWDINHKNRLGNMAYGIRYDCVCDTERCSEVYNMKLTSFNTVYDYGSSVPERVTNMLDKINLNGKVPFLYYPDLQRFIKRVRKHADKKFGAKVRYYACGEYGPVHYRPHWHILFYFDDDALSQEIEQIVCSCWRYGRVDRSFSRGSCASYLAGYVNSVTGTPSIFRAKCIRPRSFHSFHFGFKMFEEDKKEIYERGLEYFTNKVHSIYGRFSVVRPFDRLRSYFFPKCVGYARKTFDELYSVYTCYERIQRAFPFITDKRRLDYLTEMTVERDYYCGSSNSDMFIYNRNTLVGWIRMQLYPVNVPFFDNNVKYRRMFIYRLMWISKHFINYICDGDKRLYRVRLRQLIQFYCDLETSKLRSWYSALSEFSNSHLGDCYIPYYDNASLLYDDFDGHFDYDKEVKKNPVYNLCYSENCNRFDKAIKHKQLNDMNNFFNQPNY